MERERSGDPGGSKANESTPDEQETLQGSKKNVPQQYIKSKGKGTTTTNNPSIHIV
jgi:hypothetical protein